MRGDFLKNREKVQSALIDADLFESLEDTEYLIEEAKNETWGLRSVKLTNIPYDSNNGIQHIWVADPEQKESIFSLPECFKRTEKVLLIYATQTLFVLMVELKTAITLQELRVNIPKKFMHTASWIRKLLTPFVHEVEEFESFNIRFAGLVFYQNDNVTKQKIDDKTSGADKHDIDDVFDGTKRYISETNLLDNEERVNIVFQPVDDDHIEYDLSGITSRLWRENLSWDFDAAQYVERGLPLL